MLRYEHLQENDGCELICTQMALAKMGTASGARQLHTYWLFIDEGVKVSEIRHAQVC